mmetsp:Transcript_105403/g.293460  ORF Transcript_105403/g.293460 Transcript_105403/m.293460 type:complete len:492 (+) Transcript_105403:768-2243(+)
MDMDVVNDAALARAAYGVAPTDADRAGERCRSEVRLGVPQQGEGASGDPQQPAAAHGVHHQRCREIGLLVGGVGRQDVGEGAGAGERHLPADADHRDQRRDHGPAPRPRGDHHPGVLRARLRDALLRRRGQGRDDHLHEVLQGQGEPRVRRLPRALLQEGGRLGVDGRRLRRDGRGRAEVPRARGPLDGLGAGPDLPGAPGHPLRLLRRAGGEARRGGRVDIRDLRAGLQHVGRQGPAPKGVQLHAEELPGRPVSRRPRRRRRRRIELGRIHERREGRHRGLERRARAGGGGGAAGRAGEGGGDAAARGGGRRRAAGRVYHRHGDAGRIHRRPAGVHWHLPHIEREGQRSPRVGAHDPAALLVPWERRLLVCRRRRGEGVEVQLRPGVHPARGQWRHLPAQAERVLATRSRLDRRLHCLRLRGRPATSRVAGRRQGQGQGQGQGQEAVAVRACGGRGAVLLRARRSVRARAHALASAREKLASLGAASIEA